MAQPPRRRPTRPAVESLEERELLSIAGLDRPLAPRAAAWAERLAARAEAGRARPQPLPSAPARPVEVAPSTDESKGPKVLKRLRSTIYGVVVPAPWVSDFRGAAIVSGGVVWVLDLTAVKGFDSYAQELLGKAVAVFGSTEIEVDEKGKEKRKIKVGWMEPLQDPSRLPPAFPALQPILHPNLPPRL